MFVPACVNRGLAPAAAAGCYKYKSGQKYKTWTMEPELQSGSSVDPKSIASNCRRGLLTAQRAFYSFVTTLIFLVVSTYAGEVLDLIEDCGEIPN